MNIGFFSEALPYIPSPGGFRLYGSNLIRRLSQKHHIDLIAITRDEDEKHLDWPRPYCRSMVTIPPPKASAAKRGVSALSSYFAGRPLVYRPEVIASLERGMAEGKWDVLHIEGMYAGGLVPADLPIAKVLSVHDAWTLRCKEMVKCSPAIRDKAYHQMLYMFERRYQKLLFPRFERCIVVADRDKDEIARMVPEARVDMISYGTDTEYYRPLDLPKQAETLVFHGHLGYQPNVDAVLDFANNIFPLIRAQEPCARFRMTGAHPVAEIRALCDRPGIELIALPPDIRPPVVSSSIYVSAIQHGTGLKSKILEALGMQMPIVCYPGSTVGVAGVHEKHWLVAQNAQQFADYVVGLLRNPARAAEVARNGREMVERLYSWDRRIEMFEELYNSVVAERASKDSVPGVSQVGVAVE